MPGRRWWRASGARSSCLPARGPARGYGSKSSRSSPAAVRDAERDLRAQADIAYRRMVAAWQPGQVSRSQERWILIGADTTRPR